MRHLTLYRISGKNNSTIGALFLDDNFVCFTMEDPWHVAKIKGDTRIPAGTYQIELYTLGSMSPQYAKLFPKIHRGMLHLKDVPGYEGVMIHCGNTPADTRGCLLVGDICYSNVPSEGSVGSSRKCYERIYPELAGVVETEGMDITILDEQVFCKEQ